MTTLNQFYAQYYDYKPAVVLEALDLAHQHYVETGETKTKAPTSQTFLAFVLSEPDDFENFLDEADAALEEEANNAEAEEEATEDEATDTIDTTEDEATDTIEDEAEEATAPTEAPRAGSLKAARQTIYINYPPTYMEAFDHYLLRIPDEVKATLKGGTSYKNQLKHMKKEFKKLSTKAPAIEPLEPETILTTQDELEAAQNPTN